MKYFGKTDIGKIRKGNQDSFGIYEIAENALLLAVCDGMGGAAGGEEASKIAAAAFSDEIKAVASSRISEGRLDASGLDIRLMLENSAECANKAVFSRAKECPSLQGMGTTLVALFIIDGSAFSINIGDSRMYRIDADGIKQITRDHSYVQYLVDMGKITPEEARNSSNRNIITRAVGTEQKIEADIESVELGEGDGDTYFLLCSDGLSNMVGDEDICAIVSGEGELEEKVLKLIAAANEGGGSDNITAVLLKK